MKIYTVLYHDPDEGSYVVGAFTDMTRAEEQSKIFMSAFDCVEHDRDKGVDELRIYYKGEDGEPFGIIDISTLTLNEISY